MENRAFAVINDFITSFEPPCYFTTLAGRVMKLFIPKAWIDHIAWGHDNTLVRGILVSANSLTFYESKWDQIILKLTQNAKEYVFFVIVNVQVRISHKMTKNKRKPAKTSTRVECVQLVNAQPTKFIEDLRVVRFFIFGPWLKFQEIFIISP